MSESTLSDTAPTDNAATEYESALDTEQLATKAILPLQSQRKAI